MTREEEKNKARFEYVSKRLANPDFPTYNAEYELEAAFDKGYEEAIDKACEWLKEYIEWNDLCTLEDIEQFRKAMKGGEKLDADKVIEWLKPYSVIEDNIINEFKKDFGL